MPVIFSNDGFYTNLKKIDSKSKDMKAIVDAILYSRKDNFTIPYRYRVTKSALTTRRLSLVHPGAQVAVADFYRQYADIICAYNSRSEFSVRCPLKVGSSYFFRSSISDKNKYKTDGIDLLQFEKRVRNPASYFAYRGYDRQYKFFDSVRYSRLEKKYSIMWMGDLSKCFDSIYTHSVTWSVKDMPFAKDSIGKLSFGDIFDRLMQRMNYNETNGICIGPEVSRIFAETILQKVDHRVLMAASKFNLRHRVDYECVRYVDDIVVFAPDNETAGKVYALFEEELGKFNLHFNELKLKRYERPFQTEKSWIIRKVGSDLRKFQEQITRSVRSPLGKQIVPNHVFRPQSLRLNFINDIKVTCKEVGVGYDMVSNYIVASLSNRVEEIFDGYFEVDEESRPKLDDYYKNILILLDLMFHFFTLHPTVNSSFRVAKAVVLSIKLVTLTAPRRKPHLFEQLMFWSLELVKSIDRSPGGLKKGRVRIEVMNVVLSLSEHDDGRHLSEEFLSQTIFDLEESEYFSLVSILFFIGTKPRYARLLVDVQNKLRNLLGRADVGRKSDDAHLVLDILACPHISTDLRADFVKLVGERLALPTMSKARRVAVVTEIEQDYWFVNWSGIDLLNMIKRKELSQVY